MSKHNSLRISSNPLDDTNVIEIPFGHISTFPAHDAERIVSHLTVPSGSNSESITGILPQKAHISGFRATCVFTQRSLISQETLTLLKMLSLTERMEKMFQLSTERRCEACGHLFFLKNPYDRFTEAAARFSTGTLLIGIEVSELQEMANSLTLFEIAHLMGSARIVISENLYTISSETNEIRLILDNKLSDVIQKGERIFFVKESISLPLGERGALNAEVFNEPLKHALLYIPHKNGKVDLIAHLDHESECPSCGRDSLVAVVHGLSIQEIRELSLKKSLEFFREASCDYELVDDLARWSGALNRFQLDEISLESPFAELTYLKRFQLFLASLEALQIVDTIIVLDRITTLLNDSDLLALSKSFELYIAQGSSIVLLGDETRASRIWGALGKQSRVIGEEDKRFILIQGHPSSLETVNQLVPQSLDEVSQQILFLQSFNKESSVNTSIASLLEIYEELSTLYSRTLTSRVRGLTKQTIKNYFTKKNTETAHLFKDGVSLTDSLSLSLRELAEHFPESDLISSLSSLSCDLSLERVRLTMHVSDLLPSEITRLLLVKSLAQKQRTSRKAGRRQSKTYRYIMLDTFIDLDGEQALKAIKRLKKAINEGDVVIFSDGRGWLSDYCGATINSA